jgi:hypothetical protein
MNIFSKLRELYWCRKYREGRCFVICYAFDGYRSVEIVENRIKTHGTVRYRFRELAVLFGEFTDEEAKQLAEVSNCEWGPVIEGSVREMIRHVKADE